MQNWELKVQLGLRFLADWQSWPNLAVLLGALVALAWQEFRPASRESLSHGESHPEA